LFLLKIKHCMEIKVETKQILKVLHIISWIIFVGLCIEAGSFIYNAISTYFMNPRNASYFQLSNLYEYDSGYFYIEILLMTIVGVLKAILFYIIVKFLQDKKLNFMQPFTVYMKRFIFTLTYLGLGIGLFCVWGAKYREWFMQQEVKMPDVQTLNIGGADVWLFMGITLFIIAQIFKRGIEIQSENELTV